MKENIIKTLIVVDVYVGPCEKKIKIILFWTPFTKMVKILL